MHQLEEHYKQEIAQLDIKINGYKKRLECAKKTKDFDEMFVCQRLLKVLNGEREDLTFSLRSIQKYLEEVD